MDIFVDSRMKKELDGRTLLQRYLFGQLWMSVAPTGNFVTFQLLYRPFLLAPVFCDCNMLLCGTQALVSCVSCNHDSLNVCPALGGSGCCHSPVPVCLGLHCRRACQCSKGYDPSVLCWLWKQVEVTDS